MFKNRQLKVAFWWLGVVFGLAVVTLTVLPARAASSDLGNKTINQLREERDRLKQVAEQKGEQASEKADLAASAKAEIARLDKEITATQSRISSTTNSIAQTESEIVKLGEDIQVKEQGIERRENNIELTLRKFFKLQLIRERVGIVGVAFSEEGISERVKEHQNYVSVKRELKHQQEELELAKSDLEEQKNQQEEKKVQLVSYKQQQEIQQRSLSEQETRQAVLKKDAEVAYSQLKTEEKAAISKEAEIEAMIVRKIQESLRGRSGLNRTAFGEGTPVQQGDIIGHMGSTGFSTGPHVHFTVFTPEGATVNPRTRLGSAYIWPVGDYYVSQEYGPAGWRNPVYSFHNGIDLAGPAGQAVYAAADGKIILDEYYGGYGNAVVIEHSDGWLTLYGHMTGN